MDGIIYRFTNVLNGKSYIGQTINESRRESEFYDCGNYYTSSSSKIDRARMKYGVSRDIWKKDVLERVSSCDIDELRNVLNDLERYYIDKYDTFRNGYNSTSGGQDSYVVDKKVEDVIVVKKERKKVVNNKKKNNIYSRVYLCDIDGNIMKLYDSVYSVIIDGFDIRDVYNCLNGNGRYGDTYYWRFV